MGASRPIFPTIVFRSVVPDVLVMGYADDTTPREYSSQIGTKSKWENPSFALLAKERRTGASCTFKAIIAVIVTGFLGAVWLGVKATLGK